MAHDQTTSADPPEGTPPRRGTLRAGLRLLSKVARHPRRTARELSRLLDAKPATERLAAPSPAAPAAPKPPAVPPFAQCYFGMLSDEDRRMYYTAGRDYQFQGAMVDLGTFVGGTTACLICGMIDSYGFYGPPASNAKIQVYDLFKCDPFGVSMLNTKFESERYQVGDDILGLFKEGLSPFLNLIDIEVGDIRHKSWNSERHIEVLGVDLCKDITITDHVVREFFVNLQPGSIVLHQDFQSGFLPHIQVAMGYFSDRFELIDEAAGGYTVSFRMTKPIHRNELAEFSETCLRSKPDWLPLFERSVANLKTEDARMRLVPGRALLIARVRGSAEALDYAQSVRERLNDAARAELDTIMGPEYMRPSP